MEKTIPQYYPIYDTIYGTELPSEQYFVIKFDTIPSRHCDDLFYDVSIMEYLTLIGFQNICEINAINRKYHSSLQFLFINEDKKMIIQIINEKEGYNNTNLVKLIFMYDRSVGKIDEQLDLTKFNHYNRKKKKSNINLVKSDMGHLDTQEYDVKIPKLDLKLNYGEEFVKISKVIEKRLNTPNDKGIILLHGEPGSGKTTYIKYLTSLIKEKQILFIPPSMAEMLSEPTIIPFLMDHKNSILIIEDAERVIGDREGNSSPAGVSNILNLTDGILGDCLNIQVIATFNMRREKIDKALLRKGRLIAEHKFDKLSIEDTNNLLKNLGKDYISDEPMCLADIYNIDVEVYKTEEKTTRIGF